MHTFIYEYMMDLVAPALSQKPAFVTYFVARGAPRPCYIPEGFDSLPSHKLHRRFARTRPPFLDDSSLLTASACFPVARQSYAYKPFEYFFFGFFLQAYQRYGEPPRSPEREATRPARLRKREDVVEGRLKLFPNCLQPATILPAHTQARTTFAAPITVATLRISKRQPTQRNRTIRILQNYRVIMATSSMSPSRSTRPRQAHARGAAGNRRRNRRVLLFHVQ